MHINYEWLRHGHKQQMYTTAVQYENETVHSLRKTDDKQQQQIMTLQEHLIDSKKIWLALRKN